MNKDTDVKTFHILHTGLTLILSESRVPTSTVCKRGMTIEWTKSLAEAHADRNGVSALDWDFICSEDAQVHRYGKRVMAPGPFPDDLHFWEHVGAPDWHIARDAARKDALALPASEQRARFEAIRGEFGDEPSKTFRTDVDEFGNKVFS